MSNGHNGLERSPRAQGAAIVLSALLVLGWGYVSRTVLFPALWGPYALAFSDSGPLLLSCAGSAFTLSIAPLMALLLPVLRAKSFMAWAGYQLVCAALAASCMYAHGYYVHSVVHIQGVEASLRILAEEEGLDSPEQLPAHIRAAFQLSDRLAQAGTPPWRPGQWKTVAWPKEPPAEKGAATK